MRIPESQQAVASDQDDDRVSAAPATMDAGDCLENAIDVQLIAMRSRLQFMAKHVE